ncbi:MAG: serine/threonine-protein kinase, partial [Planctomycetota bacterium]
PMPTPAESSPCPACGAPRRADEPCPRCLLQLGLSHAVGANPKARPAPPTPQEIARHFPGLEIEAVIGQGGMGVVYRARQKKLARAVALKLLAPELSGDPAFAERFLREARAMARLEHPNIVAVHDFGETDGLCWILMEHVEGVNLRQALAAREITPARALAIVPKLCAALQAAHELGVVHRDIKPENVLLGADGSVKIADFGLAKLSGPGGPEAALTRTDAAMGTLHYMAPEQLVGAREVDHRADIYSLGVVFYEMLTGELPLGRFEPPSQRAAVASGVDEIVMRTLERAPEKRYQAAVEVKTDVEGLGRRAVPNASPKPATPLPHKVDGGLLAYSRLLGLLMTPYFLRWFLELPGGLLWCSLALALKLVWILLAFVGRDPRLALDSWKGREFLARAGGSTLLAAVALFAVLNGFLALWEGGTDQFEPSTNPLRVEAEALMPVPGFPPEQGPFEPYYRSHGTDGPALLFIGLLLLPLAALFLARRDGETSLVPLAIAPLLALAGAGYVRMRWDWPESTWNQRTELKGEVELAADPRALAAALEQDYLGRDFELVFRLGSSSGLEVLAVRPSHWNDRWTLTPVGPRCATPGVVFRIERRAGEEVTHVTWNAGTALAKDNRIPRWRADVLGTIERVAAALRGS